MGFIDYDFNSTINIKNLEFTEEEHEQALKWLIEKYPDSVWAITVKVQLQGL